MINNQLKILYHFAKAPWMKYSFTDMLKLTKNNSRSYIELTLKRGHNSKILKTEIIGRSILYYLDLNSAKARSYAGFVLENMAWNNKNIPCNDVELLITKIPVQNYILIVAGSYATGKQTKTSDIDIIIIVDDCFDTKKIYSELAHFSEMNIPKIHLYSFKNKEFIEMLTNKETKHFIRQDINFGHAK